MGILAKEISLLIQLEANDETFTERDTDHNNTLELNIGVNANLLFFI